MARNYTQCTDAQLSNLRKIDSILERLRTMETMREYGGWPPRDKDYLHNQWGELCEKLIPLGDWLRAQPDDFEWNADTAPITVRGAETRRRTQETVDWYAGRVEVIL